MYNKITLLALLIFSCIGNAQNLIYQEEFDGTTSYTNDPPQGYALSLEEGTLAIEGDGSSSAYTFLATAFMVRMAIFNWIFQQTQNYTSKPKEQTIQNCAWIFRILQAM